MDGGPPTKFVDTTDGVPIAYKVIGGGSLDLLWIAGLGYPSDLLFEEPGFVHLAKRLGAFSRTIWYEARGFRPSGGTFLDNTPQTIVSDLDAVLDQEGSEQAVVLGWGHSGTVAIRYAVARPDRTAALILVDTYARYLRDTNYPVGPTHEELEERLSAARPFYWFPSSVPKP